MNVRGEHLRAEFNRERRPFCITERPTLYVYVIEQRRPSPYPAMTVFGLAALANLWIGLTFHWLGYYLAAVALATTVFLYREEKQYGRT